MQASLKRRAWLSVFNVGHVFCKVSRVPKWDYTVAQGYELAPSHSMTSSSLPVTMCWTDYNHIEVIPPKVMQVLNDPVSDVPGFESKTTEKNMTLVYFR